MTMISGELQVEGARWLAVRSALRLEVKTGMKMSSRYNTAQLARDICGSTKRNKAAVLEDLQAYMDEMGFPDSRKA